MPGYYNLTYSQDHEGLYRQLLQIVNQAVIGGHEVESFLESDSGQSVGTGERVAVKPVQHEASLQWTSQTKLTD